METEKRLPDFWKEKLNKTRVKGTSSKLLEAVLEEKRREIIKEWIDSRRIEGGIEPPPVIFKIWKFLNQMIETLSIIIDRCPKERPYKREN